jgi:predicted HicB family RNase H-like nuclease
MEHKPDTTLHVRVEPELRSEIERLATADERSLSSWVRRELRDAARRQAGSEQAA